MNRFVAVLILTLSAAAARSLVQKAPSTAAATRNPYHGEETAIQAGTKLYLRECSACHDSSKAPSLRSSEVANAAPGTLSWVLRNGSLHRGMPSFAHIPEPQRWQIISYLQSERFARKHR